MAGNLGPMTVNFAILVTGLAFAIRKPLRAAVLNRHETLKKDIFEVGEKLKQAQAKHEEYSARLKSLSSEIEAIRAEGRVEARRIYDKILLESKRTSENIVNDARAIEKGLVLDLKEKLTRQLAEKIIVRAHKLLKERLTGEDRQRIRNDFRSAL